MNLKNRIKKLYDAQKAQTDSAVNAPFIQQMEDHRLQAIYNFFGVGTP